MSIGLLFLTMPRRPRLLLRCPGQHVTCFSCDHGYQGTHLLGTVGVVVAGEEVREVMVGMVEDDNWVRVVVVPEEEEVVTVGVREMGEEEVVMVVVEEEEEVVMGEVQGTGKDEEEGSRWMMGTGEGAL